MISFKEKINMSLIKNNIKIEKNPFDLLEKWYKKAKKNEISNPNAMALSTVGPFSKPRTRMVLMKEIKENGIIFDLKGIVPRETLFLRIYKYDI